MDKIVVTEFKIREKWFEGELFSFSNEFYSKFRKQMRKESDRSTVLVVAAIIDANLKELLVKKMTQGNKDTKGKIFDMGGPFHSFAPKIEWLFCVGEISKQVRDDLHIIRALRNQCAHNVDKFIFDKSIETNYLSRMNTYRLIKRAKSDFLNESPRPSHSVIEIKPKHQFTILSSVLISTINKTITKSKKIQLSFAP